MSTTIMQSLPFIIFIVSKKITKLKFLPHMDTQMISRPNTKHYIEPYFSCESKKEKKKKKESLAKKIKKFLYSPSVE